MKPWIPEEGSEARLLWRLLQHARDHREHWQTRFDPDDFDLIRSFTRVQDRFAMEYFPQDERLLVYDHAPPSGKLIDRGTIIECRLSEDRQRFEIHQWPLVYEDQAAILTWLASLNLLTAIALAADS